MSDILVVGSLAYDSIETPSGRVDRALGGSANYFSLAASLYAKVRVVGVVGEDYEEADYKLLKDRGVDLEGLEKVPGKTFHWEGKYEGDMNEAKTLRTELNVFEHFNPKLPESYKNSSFVFLANIVPALQLEVLNQVKNPQFVGMDTMNLWIDIANADLLKVLAKVDVILINETEAEMLTGAGNAIEAAAKIVELGPKAVVIKRGEYGFIMFSKEEGYFVLPAFPIAKVTDPTGAGDTFAGGFFGYLASRPGKPTVKDMKQACINGSILASHTIQDFSVKALAKTTIADIEKRMAEYKKVISI
ncbi:MAG: bifunctional hydroxymethylpyrimidine kinase/phosphomethylpyrimidine kinase [Bdellovibrionales bacterium]|nr:bifunctional hydroxymethylpyrimidine kinase/phosphomethylpyrimidine kinase [Bdellovibrionales bacterium]